MSETALRRVVRRETHSPRTVAAIVVAVLLILALAYAALEAVLRLTGQPPLLVQPGAALQWLSTITDVQPSGAVIAVALAAGILGIILVVLAAAPGRLSRQEVRWNDRAVVVDNGVIASSLAQHLAHELGVPRDRVEVGVSHRAVDVTVHPDQVDVIDEAAVRTLAEEELSSYQLARTMATRVRVDTPRETEPFA